MLINSECQPTQINNESKLEYSLNDSTLGNKPATVTTIFNLRGNSKPGFNLRDRETKTQDKPGFNLRGTETTTQNKPGFNLRGIETKTQSKPGFNIRAGNATVRPGFSIAELEKFATYEPQLNKYFSVSASASGWVFESDTSTTKIARLDTPIKDTKNGSKFKKYIQTEGTDQSFFKLFDADSNSTQVILTEGIFDALACYKAGYNAIAYPGIRNAVTKGNLNPGLVYLLVDYKQVVLGFDIDKNNQTQLYAEYHLRKLAKAIKAAERSIVTLKLGTIAGEVNAQTEEELANNPITVNIINCWDKKIGKDFNEILVNCGQNKLVEIINKTSDLYHWESIYATNNYTATVKEDSNYIDTKNMVDLVANHKYIFVKAPMGAGKTYSLASVLKENSHLGSLIISPLKILGRQIVNDLNNQGMTIKYRDDISDQENWVNICCCIQSVKLNSKVKFNFGEEFNGSPLVNKILVIDEVSQVLETIYEDSNLAKNGVNGQLRSEIIQALTCCLRSAEKCIFLSADLNDFHVTTFLKLIGEVDPAEVCTYENTRKRNTFKAYELKSVNQALTLALNLIHEGKKVFIGIDSQKISSVYGTKNLLGLFTEAKDRLGLINLLDQDAIIIDSEAVKETGNEAVVVIAGEKYILRDKSLVIVTPSAASGFSCDPKDYKPDAVILIHMGCASPDTVAQLSMRVRAVDESVPRYFAFGGTNQLSYGGGLSRSQIKEYVTQQVNKVIDCANSTAKSKVFKKKKVASSVNLDMVEEVVDFAATTINIDLGDMTLENEFYQLKAINNLARAMRKEYIFSKLRSQGAVIEKLENSPSLKIKPHLKEIRETNLIIESTEEFEAETIDEKTIEKLKEQPTLTQAQKNSVSKFYTQKSFRCLDVTASEILDKKIGLLPGEDLLFWLTDGRSNAEFNEQERILRSQGVPIHNPTKLMQLVNASGVYKHDLIKGSTIIKVHLLEELGIHEFLDYVKDYGLTEFFLIGTDEETIGAVPVLDLITNIKENARRLKAVFNWTSKDFSKDLKILDKVLEEIGLKRSNPYRVRVKVEGKTKQKTISDGIVPNRNVLYNKNSNYVDTSVKSREKRFKLLLEESNEKRIAFEEAQELAEIGQAVIAGVEPSKLLKDFPLDKLIDSSKRLPRIEYGFSKLFEILRHHHSYTVNTTVPDENIILVDENNLHELVTAINTWIQNKSDIGFDTETYGSIVHDIYCDKLNEEKMTRKWLNPQTGRKVTIKPGLDQNNNQVRLIQVTDGTKIYVIDLGKNDAAAVPIWFKEGWKKLELLCKKNTIIGHNLKFDTSTIRKYGLIVRKPYDSMISAKLAFGDCGAGKVLANGNGLKSVAHNLLNVEVDKTEQNSNWGAETLSKSQVIYAAKDAILALEIKRFLDEFMANPTKWGFSEFASETGYHANRKLINTENKVIRNVTEMQHWGVPCDILSVKNAIAKLEATKKETEKDWDSLGMTCKPSQAKLIIEELNRRYYGKNHPFKPEELIEALGVENVSEDTLKSLPELEGTIMKSTSKDVINDNPDIPELLVLKAWRSINTAITQLSKVLLSVEIHGTCKTEYGILSGTGRMNCGGQYSLGAPNLQAFIKKAKADYYGYTKNDEKIIFWSRPAITVEVKIRELFKLSNGHQAFFTEDANASHARLAVGFGQCEFGKKVLEDENMDAHSMFAMMALQVLLNEDANCLDSFPEIRDFIKDLSEDEIKTVKTAKSFKKLDAEKCGKRFRDAAKTLYYSVLNGAQADKMRKTLAGTIAQPVSVTAGEEMFNKFWSLYTGIKAFIDKVLAEAAANEVNYGGVAFNVTTLPDGTKLLYAKKNGDLATTNLIACQWSRCEATALKKVMLYIDELPTQYAANLVNMVHDEVGVVCNSNHWIDAYKLVSDKFAEEYNKYLKGFVPSDQSTEVKIKEKLANNINYVPTNWGDK